MIEAISLTKRFGTCEAVSELSFQISSGEVVGLLGPNGAGKTTTMRMLTGYMPPSSGQVKISGYDLAHHPRLAKNHLGYLPENPPLYAELTVEEMLFFVAGLRGIPKKNRHEQIEKTLLKTGTMSVKKRLIGNISKGFRQRVGIAQAILHEPSFLILDEPTIGLDPRQMVEIRELIGSLDGVSILLSSHLLQEISLICDRVLIIHRGKLVADGSIPQLTGGESVDNASALEKIFMQLTQEA